MTRKWKEEGGSKAVLEVNDPRDDGRKKINLQRIGSVLLQSKLEVMVFFLLFLWGFFLLLLSFFFYFLNKWNVRSSVRDEDEEFPR